MGTVRELQSLDAAEKRRGTRSTTGFELALQLIVGVIIVVAVGYFAK